MHSSRSAIYAIIVRSSKVPYLDGFVPLGEDKSHTRIIWDCAWTRESDVFATASRDKTVCNIYVLLFALFD